MACSMTWVSLRSGCQLRDGGRVGHAGCYHAAWVTRAAPLLTGLPGFAEVDMYLRTWGLPLYYRQPDGHGSKEAGMAEVVAEQVRRYVLDGSDEDLRRLLSISRVTAETARRAFRRAGICEGGR